MGQGQLGRAVWGCGAETRWIFDWMSGQAVLFAIADMAPAFSKPVEFGRVMGRSSELKCPLVGCNSVALVRLERV